MSITYGIFDGNPSHCSRSALAATTAQHGVGHRYGCSVTRQKIEAAIASYREAYRDLIRIGIVLIEQGRDLTGMKETIDALGEREVKELLLVSAANRSPGQRRDAESSGDELASSIDHEAGALPQFGQIPPSFARCCGSRGGAQSTRYVGGPTFVA
jgi:hypothetical protein